MPKAHSKVRYRIRARGRSLVRMLRNPKIWHTWSQVHLERSSIDLEKTRNGNARTVRLNQAAVTAVASRRSLSGGLRVFQREGTSDRFDTRSWFVPCLEQAGINGYVWHSNRHTFCSCLVMAGETDREIMEAAGHKTIAMAARYSHLSPRHQQSVVDRLVSLNEPTRINRHSDRHQPQSP